MRYDPATDKRGHERAEAGSPCLTGAGRPHELLCALPPAHQDAPQARDLCDFLVLTAIYEGGNGFLITLSDVVPDDVPAIAELAAEMDRFYGATELDPVEIRWRSGGDRLRRHCSAGYPRGPRFAGLGQWQACRIRGLFVPVAGSRAHRLAVSLRTVCTGRSAPRWSGRHADARLARDRRQGRMQPSRVDN